MAIPVSRAAIIPAAGFGTRLNKGPKGFLKLADRTLIEWVAHTLEPIVDIVVIAVPEGYQAIAAGLLPNCLIITGGNSRHHTINKLFDSCNAQTILLQDAARPFASQALCEEVLTAAEKHKAAGAFVDPVVPIGKINNNHVTHFWHHSEVGIFQAPQAFSYSVLAQALQQPKAESFQSTAQLVMSAGQSLYAVRGEAENIKITSPLDWDIAEKVIAPKLGYLPA
ncbi:IspD/TarI family cytidylyltransferase [Gilvimarinus polysaccharolyticus]|uniref:IspD/TarI family cytidylyltransferase n=1 Tax=Gilvimarinus polysaccharolyticus TaxID=863921 RepID=UPI00067326CE|nr:2-C-methyl-D-erythritol 4-phosphate cytidylyltransferase [Gilvimarinus polysaccharolyticus]